MKALITGITGQDGAYLSKLLIEKGYEVHGITPMRSNIDTTNLQYLGVETAHVIAGDLTDATCINGIIERGQYNEVYNLGAQSFVAQSFNQPAHTFEVNAKGVINLLDAIHRHSPYTHVYQASTSEMFGGEAEGALNEHSIFNPRSPYAVAKLAAHEMCKIYREAQGMHISCGILFNHESPIRGKQFVTRKITDGIALIKAGLADKLVLGNTQALRDWGYAEDYVEAMWLMMQQEESDDYVIATGCAYSVHDFCVAAFDVAGLKLEDHLETSDANKRPLEVHGLCGDASKAKAELGWEAKTSLHGLITKMIAADFKRYGVEI
jgi:GDPmannose 4,6-dehydratase